MGEKRKKRAWCRSESGGGTLTALPEDVFNVSDSRGGGGESSPPECVSPENRHSGDSCSSEEQASLHPVRVFAPC